MHLNSFRMTCSAPSSPPVCRLQLGPPPVHPLPGRVVVMATSTHTQPQQIPSPADVQNTKELIKQLELQAMEAHEQAQQLNKQGRFEEAQAKYAEMRRLDALALDATQSLGCPSCREAAQAAAATRAANSQQQLENSALYQRLHAPTSWPSATGPLAVQQRAFGSILGCCVADAAATPVQWIYDVNKLEELLEQRRQVAGSAEVGLEFFDPVQSSFLPMYVTGRNSPYGEQTLLLLQSLADQGGLHCGQYAALYEQHYRNGFDGYMNASTVAFLRNSARGMQPPETGAEDQQADCVARLAPLVAMYAGDERLMQLVEAATRTTQNTDTAVAWACAGAAVLERLLRGLTAREAVTDTVKELQQKSQRMPDQGLAVSIAGHLSSTLELQPMPHTVAVQELGRNCHMPNALQTPIHAVLHHEWLAQQQQQHKASEIASLAAGAKQKLFVAAIRDVLLAGGCCASRASYAGACLGALLGADAISSDWVERSDAGQNVQQWAEAVCSARNR